MKRFWALDYSRDDHGEDLHKLADEGSVTCIVDEEAGGIVAYVIDPRGFHRGDEVAAALNMYEEGLTAMEQLDAYDNGGATVDRYTVVMPDGDLLVMSENPNHPQGVRTYLEQGSEPMGALIAYSDLPAACRRQVEFEIANYYAVED